ncbi:MAG: H-type lectin domain-containing protein [Oscillatoria sp. Prado101]|jgi:hypothetical protein|nr:H-type lectin domain-containing protein [Oscillatoria sp. Prado101]
MTALDGQLTIPCSAETGVEFTNTQSSDVTFKFTPSSDIFSLATAFELKSTPAGIKDFKYQSAMKYPNNTSFALLAVSKQTGAVVAEVGQETTLVLKPGETLIFILNDVPRCYNDNTGTITVKWSGVSVSALKIQSGTVVNGSYQDAAWKLHQEPIGERLFTRPVQFESKFAKPPKVFLEISGLDVNETKNTRVTVTAKNITESGFDLEYKTWFDTILYTVWANWMAFGE